MRLLEERFANITELRGTTITHEEIETLIREKRDSNRYQSITYRWRKRVRQSTGVIIEGRGEAIGVGFRVLLDGEQIHHGIGHRQSAFRKLGRWREAVAGSDIAKLTEEQRVLRERELIAAGRMKAAMLESRRKPTTLPSASSREG